MKLNFCPTFGKKLYYLGDASDDNAPVLRFQFCTEDLSEFKFLTSRQKEHVAHSALLFAMAMIEEYATESEEQLEPSKPLSEATVRVGNSLLTARVPEDKIQRDYDEEL